MPFFSVVIPVHNKVEHLEKSLACVYDQSFQDFEIIAVDDCSSDGSLEILQQHARAGRLTLFQRNEPGPGGYAARNLGVEKANAEWIVFFDADDIMYTNHLNDLHDMICQNPDLQFFCCNYYKRAGGKVSAKKVKIKSGKYRRLDGLTFYALDDFIHMNSACTHVTLFKELGGFPEGEYKRGGDVYFWVKLLTRIDGFFYSDRVTSEWHVDHSGVTKNPHNLTLHPLADFLKKETLRLDKACDLQLRKIINRKVISWAAEKKVQGKGCYKDFPHINIKGLGFRGMSRVLMLCMPLIFYIRVVRVKRASEREEIT